jgi:hypothetical protein
MTETTRFVSKPTAVCILASVIAALFLMMFWAHERYGVEQKRSCMDGVVRPFEWDPEYDEKMLEFTSDVRGCMRG